ncbi:MAG: DUF1592 domain-containing protein [Myxococcota bacterium]
MVWKSSLFCFVLAAVVGCQGTIDDVPPRPVDQPVVQRSDGSFECKVTDRPSAGELQRLPGVQLQRTLASLLEGIDVEEVAGDAIERLPRDGGLDIGRFSRGDNRLSPAHVDAYFRIADAIAAEFEASSATRAGFIGDCANEAMINADCVDRFLDGFMFRAARHPVDSVTRDRFHALNDGVRTGPELARALVFAALMSPQFLYKLELGGDAISGDDYHLLDGYALASRLSYHFWRTMPDEQLFARAADGALLTDEGFAAEVERIFEHPRTQEASHEFYREWLAYDQLGGFPDTDVFNAFAAGVPIHDPANDYIVDMRAEVDGLLHHFTWNTEGSFRDVLVTERSFTRSPQLAALYGVPPWDGVSEPPRMPAGERSGLLTRAAFLISGKHVTNPMFRGALVRREILCEEIHPPDNLDPDALATPEFSTRLTTRERYEIKTSRTECVGCHTRINPIGFILESYDALGRYRTHERVYDDQTGELLAELPIDTTVQPNVTAVDTDLVDSPSEMMERVAESNVVEGCFARQYFHYTYGRSAQPGDGCALESIRSALMGSEAQPGSLGQALRAIALHPSFRQRAVRAQEGN